MVSTGELIEGRTRERKHSTLSHKGRLDMNSMDILCIAFDFSEMVFGLYMYRREFERLIES